MPKRLLLALTTILILLLAAAISSAQGPTLTVHFIDVGQGDSILIQAPSSNELLIDAGEQKAGPIVVDYLRKQKVDDLEYVVSTHPHADHIGGLRQVLEAFPVERVIDSGKAHGSQTYENYLLAIQAKKIPYQLSRAGQQFDLAPGVKVYVLGPVQLSDEVNDCSVVLRIVYGKTAYLFMGDAETREEQSILATGVELKADVLKAGHHGSRTSTSRALFDRVLPRYMVILCGAGNDYGHPHVETLSYAAQSRIPTTVFRTDTQGTIISTSDGAKVEIKAAGKTGLSSGGLPAGAVVASVPAPSSGSYIGNLNTKKFHRATCSYLPDPKNRVYFGTRDDAIKAGYVPCKKCNP